MALTNFLKHEELEIGLSWFESQLDGIWSADKIENTMNEETKTYFQYIFGLLQ